MVNCSICSLVKCFFDGFSYLLSTIVGHPLTFLISFIFALYILNVLGSVKEYCGNSDMSTNTKCESRQQTGSSSSPCCNLLSACTSSVSFCSTTVTPTPIEYTADKGPHTWEFRGCNQSPINVLDECVRRCPIREMLIWNHYEDLPEGVLIENTGSTVVMRASFSGNTPTVSGGDLLACYSFVELCFRWSAVDNEGSEHMINYRKFPMEMQAMHRTGPQLGSTSSYDLLYVAYFFEISAHNPYLDPIIQNLFRIQKPCTKVEIAPFPLAYLCYPFRSSFYSYAGSLTEPPCYQGAEWFIFPEPLAISEQQLFEFRQILGNDGKSRILRNSRPVQRMTDQRLVNYNIYNPVEVPRVQEAPPPENLEVEEEETC